MILIFGGAYQGKLEYAKEHWNFSDEDVFFCDESLTIDLSKKVICGLEKFVYACVLEGAEAKDVLKSCDDENPLREKIWIVDDISQGVVPIDPDRRAWRESVGRTLLWLGKESDEVHRVFCGLGQRLK